MKPLPRRRGLLLLIRSLLPFMTGVVPPEIVLATKSLVGGGRLAQDVVDQGRRVPACHARPCRRRSLMT